MDCTSESASHYAGCSCNEERWRERLAAAERRAEEAERREAKLHSEVNARLLAHVAITGERDAERAARERAERERDEARASVGRCHTLIDGLWAITDPEKHPDIVASVDAELAPCDRHYAENEALRSRLSRAVEALRGIAATTGCMKDAESDPFRPLAMMPWEDGPAVYQTPFCGSCSSCIARAVLVEVEK